MDQLVDSIAEHELLSFIDAYLGYNKIHIFPADEDDVFFYCK